MGGYALGAEPTYGAVCRDPGAVQTDHEQLWAPLQLGCGPYTWADENQTSEKAHEFAK